MGHVGRGEACMGKSWGPLVEGVGRGACWERGGLGKRLGI